MKFLNLVHSLQLICSELSLPAVEADNASDMMRHMEEELKFHGKLLSSVIKCIFLVDGGSSIVPTEKCCLLWGQIP
jgi:hypothetical protein